MSVASNGSDPQVEARRTAREAGLAYATDEAPGLTRRRRGKGWSYHRPDGSLERDPEVRDRIASLAIPPAWTDVWVSPDPKGHIQATGRDDRGRKQYRYHPRWEEVRAEIKFDRLREFGSILPTLRRAIARGLESRPLGRDQVLSAVLRMMELTAIRVGNDEYARENDTYGLTTLRDRHVTVNGTRIRLRFEAKGGQETEMVLEDRVLAKIVKACQDVPGYEVFKWLDEDGVKHDVKSDDVNDYLRDVSGADITAKDVRTWMGTLHAFRHLCGVEPAEDESEREAACLAAVDEVAERLRNTREVARASYIHPGVLESYRDASLCRRFRELASRARDGVLSADERALVRLLDELADG